MNSQAGLGDSRANVPAFTGSVADYFAAIAAQHGNRLAVKSGDETLTYRQLDGWANRLAHAILARRPISEAPICLLLASSTRIPVGFLGIIKSGNYYIPLDTSNPPSRLTPIIQESGASVLIADAGTHADALRLAADSGIADVLNLDDLASDLAETPPTVALTPQSPAYRYYTSGTTGRPKGVTGTHFQVLYGVLQTRDLLKYTSDDRLSILTSYSFGAARKVLFDALLTGASAHLFDVRSQGIAGLADWFASEEITVYASTSSLFRHFASMLPETRQFPCMRLISLAGEPVLRHDFELYKRHFPDHCVFTNQYGTTETSSIAIHMIDKSTSFDGPIVPIGYPVPGNRIDLLDEAGNPVPKGEVGEIVVTGPRISASRHVAVVAPSAQPSPFRVRADGEVAYYTGDLGRLRPDDALEHWGRKDLQLKIRGFRVEPAEVEMALLDHEAIRFAAVVTADAPNGSEGAEKRLVAYFVADRLIPILELREFVAKNLPSYMIPSAFIRVDALPLNVTGKLDRAALPAPDWSRVERATPLVQPRTLTEKRLAGRWGQVLGIDKFSIHDRFYDLGGSSLMAAQMLTLVGRDVGRTLSLALLEKHGTLAEFAAFLDQSTPRTSTRYSPLIAIRSEGRRPPLFCFPARQGFVTNFFLLARYLDAEQPVYAFQQRGLDGQDEPNRTLDEMVTEFMGHIRRVQPHGPYYLCGRSFGGVVAYETAQRLVAAGEQVGCVVLFDSAFPSLVRRRTDGTYPMFVLRTAFRALRALTGPPATWRGRWKDLYRRWKRRTRYTFSRGAEERIYRLNASFYRQYRVEPYPGRLTFFTALPDRRPDEREARWQAMARGGFELVKVPGGHSGMLHEPHIRVTGQRLEECLLAAQRQYRAQSETNPESTPDASHMSGIGRES